MSLAESKGYRIRAGRVDCACGLPATDDSIGRSDRWRLGAGFACAVVAQALLLSSLPFVGRVVAPSPALANLPYALTWVGAALASFPASILMDQFGRRAAFALGASTGAAGGLIAAWAAAHGNFPILCIGAVWLGVAQGFALFYRHAGATQRGRTQTLLTVMAGGCLAGLIVPSLVAFATEAYAPFADCALLVFAGLTSLAALPLILALPHVTTSTAIADRKPESALFWIATAMSASSWGIMSNVMAGTPHILADCGVGIVAISGMISWHFLAMYGPLAVGTHLMRWLGLRQLSLLAITFLLCALVYAPASGGLGGARLLIGGLGWSFAQISSASLLHQAGTPARRKLALHDALILFSALAGVLAG